MKKKCDCTQGENRPPALGTWCIKCGKKVYDVEKNECSGCKHSKLLFDGWICRKHLMQIHADMRVCYKISEGSCWEN